MPRWGYVYERSGERAAEDEVPALARTTTTTLEREDIDFARNRATLERLNGQLERLRAITEDGLGSVSSKQAAQQLNDLEFLAGRLSTEIDTKPVERANFVPSRYSYGPRFRPGADELAQAGRLRPNKQETNNYRQVSRNSDQFPRTVFGTDAWLSQSSAPGRRLSRGGHFYSPSLSVPCIQRDARRQVLFARGKGGKGHKGKRRPSKYGDIWC